MKGRSIFYTKIDILSSQYYIVLENTNICIKLFEVVLVRGRKLFDIFPS